jgi:hypothetical protein
VLNHRAGRHEQLCIYIGDGMESAIAANDKHETSIGDTAATPYEINMALAHVIFDRIWRNARADQQNEREMKKFIHLLRQMGHVPREENNDDFLPQFYTEDELFPPSRCEKTHE